MVGTVVICGGGGGGHWEAVPWVCPPTDGPSGLLRPVMKLCPPQKPRLRTPSTRPIHP